MYDLPDVFETMVDSVNEVHKPAGNFSLHTNNSDIINELAFYVHKTKSSITVEIQRLNTIKMKAMNTLAFIQKEYHLQ